MASFQPLGGFDLPSIYMAAMNVRDMNRKRELEEQKLQIEREKQQAIQQALASGDMNAVAQIDPVLAFKFAQEQRDAVRFEREGKIADVDYQTKSNELYQKRFEQSSGVLANIFEQAAKSGDLAGHLNNLAATGQINTLDPQLVRGAVARAQKGEDLTSIANDLRFGAGVNEKFQSTADLNNFAVISGVKPQEVRDNPELGARFSKFLAEQTEKRANKIVLPGEASAANVTDLQKNIAEAQNTFSTIDRLRSLGKTSDFVGLRAKFGNAYLDTKGWLNDKSLSDSERDKLARAAEFDSTVTILRALRQKFLTGTGGSARELETYEKALFNTKGSPEVFDAQLNRYEQEMRNQMEIAQSILRQGYDLGTPEYQNKLNLELGRRENANAKNKPGKPIELKTREEKEAEARRRGLIQ